MPTSKELREKLVPLAQQIYQMRDKANDASYTWTAEDEANWSKINADYETGRALCERAEKAESVERFMASSPNQSLPGRDDFDGKKAQRAQKFTGRQRRENFRALTHEEQAVALQGWMRSQSGLSLRREHRDLAERTGINYRTRNHDIRLERDYRAVKAGAQQRAQSINIQTAGGYTIPQGFVPNLEVALLAYANVREWADVMRTESGNDLPLPTVNDTSNKGQILAENTQVSEKDVAFGQMVLHSFKYTTGLVLVPAELLEDSAFNLAQWLAQLMGIRLGRIQADHFTFGTGAGQPMGYVSAATLGITTASATAIAADELYNLKHSVDPLYRPGAVWTFHDQVFLYIKKLKDGNGRYLWQSGMATAVPDTLDGDKIGINQSMASVIAAGNITVCYGQMSKYKIRDVSMLRMRRLVERYADYDQEGFVGFFRCDGNLLDAGTHPIKYLQQV